MDFMPAFEIGLWNAWIFMIFLIAASYLPSLIDKEKMRMRMEEEPSWSELNKITKIVFVITHIIILPFTLIYSIFLPIKLGTLWFFAGLPIYLLGLVMVLLYSISFSTAPLGKPLSKGIYAISRHPSYVGSFLGFIGIGIVCASWVFLLLGLSWIVSLHFGVIEEELILLEKYEDAYREYMEHTPRWIGLPKSK